VTCKFRVRVGTRSSDYERLPEAVRDGLRYSAGGVRVTVHCLCDRHEGAAIAVFGGAT
jgi:hypothetical protein